MNQVQPELTLDESVRQVMQTLPPVIRNFLSQGKTTSIAKSLMGKYGLRIDQGGILDREIMLLLMGIETPDEFTQSLVEEAKLDKQTIEGIVQDINAQIFVPLREEEEHGGRMTTSQSPKPPIVLQPKAQAQPQPPEQAPAPASHFHLENNISHPTTPPAPRPTNASMLNYAPPLQSPKYQNFENNFPPIILIQPMRLPISIGASLPRKVVSSFPVVATPPRPISNIKLLEDHEEPHIEFNKNPVSVPIVKSATRLPQWNALPKPISPIATTNTPSAKPYSTDPYREPI